WIADHGGRHWLRLAAPGFRVHARRRHHARRLQFHFLRGVIFAGRKPAQHMVEPIQWTDAVVVMIDKTRLPREASYVTCTTYVEVAEAIRAMVIRGAPAIGVAAAMGVALGVAQANGTDLDAQFEK